MTDNYFVDAHTHIVPCVDDGSTSLDASIKMIEEEIGMGVKTILCTPHYRKGMFESDNELIEINFKALCDKVCELGLDVKLYLGREIYVNSIHGGYERTLDRIRSGEVKGYNNTNNYLLEFSYTKEIDIGEVAYSMKTNGFTPVIAHIERYTYLVDDLEKIYDIKNNGGIIQVNASSIIGKDGFRIKRYTKKLLENDLVDIISSDIHENRVNYFKKAYDYICKKFNKELADKLFFENPIKLIK